MTEKFTEADPTGAKRFLAALPQAYNEPGHRRTGHGPNPRAETHRRRPGEQMGNEPNPRSLAGKPLAGFCATRGRRIQDLYSVVVHVIRCNTHYAIDNRR